MKSDKFLTNFKTKINLEPKMEKRAFFTLKKGNKINFNEVSKREISQTRKLTVKPVLPVNSNNKHDNSGDLEKEQTLEIQKVRYETPSIHESVRNDNYAPTSKPTTNSKNEFILVEKTGFENPPLKKNQNSNENSNHKNEPKINKSVEKKEVKVDKFRAVRDSTKFVAKTRFADVMGSLKRQQTPIFQAHSKLLTSSVDRSISKQRLPSRSKEQSDSRSRKLLNSVVSNKSLTSNLNSNLKTKNSKTILTAKTQEKPKLGWLRQKEDWQRDGSPPRNKGGRNESISQLSNKMTQSTSGKPAPKILPKSNSKTNCKNAFISNINDSHSQSRSSSRNSTSVSSKNISSQKMLQKLKERSEIAHNSFKINLQDLIKVDEIFVDILTRKEFEKTFENFDMLREFLVNQYCFVLKDLNLLFCNEKFREIMRINYLKEVLYFTYIYILIVKNRFEFAGLQKSVRASPSRIDSEYVKSYIVSINKETEDLMLQVLSYIHIVFILRAEIFLDQATVYYQNSKLFRKLQLLLSKRKSRFNISASRKDNYEEHIVKINRYLDLCEQALHELFKLNPSFTQISKYLMDSLILISKREGELKISDFNQIFSESKVVFDAKGLFEFSPELLLHDSPILFESDLSESKPSAPFVKDALSGNRKMTLVIDLDETLIHYPEEHLKDLDSRVNVLNVRVRPHALEFLQQMSVFYELMIFTAASQSYADPIIDFIDPSKLVTQRLYRQHLSLHNGKLIKDLSKIGRNLKKLIMLDNLPENFILQEQNGVYVKSWLGDENDRCLLLLLSVFVYIANNTGDDVRNVLLEFKNILVENIK